MQETSRCHPMLTLLSHIRIRCSWQKHPWRMLKKAWGKRTSSAFMVQHLAPSIHVPTQQSPSCHVEWGPVQLLRAAPGCCHLLHSSVVADGFITLTLGRLFPDFTHLCHPPAEAEALIKDFQYPSIPAAALSLLPQG